MASDPASSRRPAVSGTPTDPATDVPHASQARRRRGVGQPLAAARYLGAHLFAFYRGVLEGLDLADLGARYLDTGRDRRQARLTQQAIEAELLRGVRRLSAGASQASCRLGHAANGCISTVPECVLTTESRSGFSVTAPMGAQFRVVPDQRRGLRSRAWR